MRGLGRFRISAKRRLSLGQAGFTIPELIIMMIVTTMMTLLVLDFALHFWGATATLGNDATSLASRLNVGDALRDNLNVTSGLINQNGIPDANAANPDSTAGANYWTYMHAIPGTVAMSASGTTIPIVYYRAPSIDTSKNLIMNGTVPYQDEFVLYMDGTSKQLLLRSLANPAASGDKVKTSCPAALAAASCPADKILGSDISSVSTRYFSRSGNLINYTSVIDPITGDYIGPDFPSVEVMELTINFYKKSTIHGGTDTSNQTIVRVALRNG